MQFALTGDRIAVKLDEPESVSGGGIVLPDSAQDKSQRGTVVAVGPGKFSDRILKHVKPPVSAGDRVIVERYGQMNIKIDGEELAIIHEEDLVALLPSPAKAAKK